VLFDIRPLLNREYEIIVLCAELRILSNWMLLWLGNMIGTRIILWGHGLNAVRYDRQSRKMPWIRKYLYRLSGGAWFYTEKEKMIWDNLQPSLKSVALGNTIDVRDVRCMEINPAERRMLSRKHGIERDTIFIFCARIVHPNRRIDLLIKLIESLDHNRYGFIIIGDGPIRPDFTNYGNVCYMGSVYDRNVKHELFALADAYLQPGWLGLSAVEAMAYGKAVLSLARSIDVPQCVEYGYIQSGITGYLARDIDDLVQFIETVPLERLHGMGRNARDFVMRELTIDQMVGNAIRGVDFVLS
jgi:glycosyltransferase involved in cell wall biosynthesis